MINIDAWIIDSLGYLAAGIVFLTFSMKNMRSLRIVAVVSNMVFIFYAFVAGLMPILTLHLLLLPLNILRLLQMQQHLRMMEEAEKIHPDKDRFDWLIPLGKTRILKADQTLFSKGDPAKSLFVVVEGEILLPEHMVTLGPGEILGELALFSVEGIRTAGARAVGRVKLVELTGRQFQALYFDNPSFAYGLVRLITRRLLDNARTIDKSLAE